MAVRRCLGRCGRIIRAGSYCPACRPRNGSTRSWRQTRARVLYRDAYRCQHCHRAAAEVDHIVPVIDGGSDHPANLRSLCHDCHRGP
jgi:5-methylcytosine-specific restriction endonuclease McrA